MTKNRTIRMATAADLAEIMKVMEAAKAIMRSSGNMHQWIDGYPSEAVILSDMEKNGGFVIVEAGHVIAYFAFLPSPEPTYARIYEDDRQPRNEHPPKRLSADGAQENLGKWLDDVQPYHVVHRIASYPDAHHVFRDIMDFCFTRDANIRIDTHRDNTIMQHVIKKYGFTFCGIIYLDSGDERLAYQRIAAQTAPTCSYS
ncbi:MAG: N-acetyltransferase [Prevotella sp.]|nr:N-acetyltransferase [Prevotella sp.]